MTDRNYIIPTEESQLYQWATFEERSRGEFYLAEQNVTENSLNSIRTRYQVPALLLT